MAGVPSRSCVGACRDRRSALALGLAVFTVSLATFPRVPAADEPYKRPPQAVVDLLDAPPPPIVVPNPSGDMLLLVDVESYPPIELLSRPFLKLAGIRVDAAIGAKRRETRVRGLSLQGVGGGKVKPVALPSGARVGFPTWSFDGKRFAFTRDMPNGVELWVADGRSGEARAIAGVRVTDVLGTPVEWTRDGRHLLVRTVPAGRGAAPAASAVPVGPHTDETAGKRSRMATFRDLLTDAHDEDLFDYYGTVQLVVVDCESGTMEPLGAPGLYGDVEYSPSGEYLLVTRYLRPFSFRVPADNFAQALEVWRRDGSMHGVLARLPVADEVPQQGVPTGPREVQWQPLQPSTLVWAEALDGGDPMAQAEHRDRVMRLVVSDRSGRGSAKSGATGVSGESAPAANELAAAGEEILQLRERFNGFTWAGRRDQVLIGEYDRKRRWTTTWFADFAITGRAVRKMFDRSINDAYGDPGEPVMQVQKDGSKVVRQDGDFIYLSGRGATPKGDRPFLDRMNLRSLAKSRLFESRDKKLEFFLCFTSGTEVVISSQSRTEPPNAFRLNLVSKQHDPITDYRDPAPQITGVEKRLLTYHRADGTPLTAFLYLPPGYTPGTRLPMMVWAYPREFSDGGTAGQVRGSENTFLRLTGASQLFFLTQGYAVLDDPTMPVLGDPETMNDTYVEQIVAAAKAAVDTVVAMGIADPDRVGIGGHSYGAFMTANLLAHSNLFAAGIARSGAYNRSLTPFGFQSERRSYWEARDVYTRVSPFTYANDIHAPILLIHGEEDTNSGTFPIQSERLFQALQGNGGTARLVMLPFEGHGYRARESVLHTLAEMFDWADKWVKNRPARAVQESRR